MNFPLSDRFCLQTTESHEQGGAFISIKTRPSLARRDRIDQVVCNVKFCRRTRLREISSCLQTNADVTYSDESDYLFIFVYALGVHKLAEMLSP